MMVQIASAHWLKASEKAGVEAPASQCFSNDDLLESADVDAIFFNPA